MTQRIAVVIVTLVLSLADAASLSAQSVSAGDTSRLPAPDATIRGRIVAADTGRPLRRAQVTITAPELSAQRRANTGLDGRYEFKDLPAGRYTVSVTRSGYLAMRYGQRRPMEQARPLQLEEAQALNGIDVALPRTGIITGRILDDAGEPMAGVLVQALRPAWVEGRRQLVIAAMSGFQGTDDTGQYRLTDLPPGQYFVRATTRETWMVVSKGVREPMGFTPTYFPATPNQTAAALVEVAVGQRVTNADISLVPGRPANISGLAFDSRGVPLAGQAVGLMQRFLRESPGGGGSTLPSSQTNTDGSFTFRNITPGEYQLSVTTGNFNDGQGETAVTEIVVDGVDVDDVRLTTSAGWSVTGRVVTEDGVPPAFARNAMRVGAMTVRQVSGRVGAGEVADDWAFSVKTIIGDARLWATVPNGWMVKGFRAGTRDITSMLLEMKSGERLSDVEVIVTDQITRVTGQLTDERGVPLANGTIIVFSEDSARWGQLSAYVRTIRPDQDGRYEFRGLPAGDYLAIAVDYVQDGLWNDPEYLESLRPHAQRLTVVDGGSHPLSLTVTQP